MTKFYCPSCETQLTSIYDGRGYGCPNCGIIEEDFYLTIYDLAWKDLVKAYFKTEDLDYDNAESYNENGVPETPEWLGKFAYSIKHDYEQLIVTEPNTFSDARKYYLMRYYNLFF